MGYLYNIQIDDNTTLYAMRKVDEGDNLNSQIDIIMSTYFGGFSFYDADDEWFCDFDVFYNGGDTNETVSYKSISSEDIVVNIYKVDNDFDDKVVKDNVIYTIMNKVSLLLEQNNDGVEADGDGLNEIEDQPYNTELIRVDPKQMQISYIHELINDYMSLELSADFQRNFIWTDAKRKSRLIESILLRIPLPAFYFSTDKNGTYQIVDGLQRINVINMFINGEFKLTDLEYLDECKDCFFSEKYDKNKKSIKRKYLNSKYIRRILETQLSINVIDPQTPIRVKYDIFKRLNTGGKPLNNMEIRNSFATSKTREFIRGLTKIPEYKASSIASVNSTRFADQEMVLRFVCFFRGVIKGDSRFVYRGNMDMYLDDTIEFLNTCDKRDLSEIETSFKKMLTLNGKLFGKYAFRKVFPNVTSQTFRMPLINKSLFTAMSILTLKHCSKLSTEVNSPIHEIVEGLGTAISTDYRYYESLSYGTNDKDRVETVFKRSEAYIMKLIEG